MDLQIKNQLLCNISFCNRHIFVRQSLVRELYSIFNSISLCSYRIFDLFSRLRHYSGTMIKQWPLSNGCYLYAVPWASYSMAICLYLTKSKRCNNDEIIYKFNRGYEFTSHIRQCVYTVHRTHDNIQCARMGPIARGQINVVRRKYIVNGKMVAGDSKKKTEIDVLARMITVLSIRGCTNEWEQEWDRDECWICTSVSECKLKCELWAHFE